MITSDEVAKEIIDYVLSHNDLSSEGHDILETTRILQDVYSFVENQTYPRPEHPFPEKRKDAYFTLIAVLLSLRTTLENEMKAVESFCNRYSSINEVLTADIEELAQTIKCAGMPYKKATVIVNVSKYIKQHYNGDINNINNGNVEEVRIGLLEIPGLGEKSVDCMLELAFNLPSIVVDINVFRVISRMYFTDENMSFTNKKHVSMVKNYIELNIVRDYRIYQIVHTIILLHGKFVCKSKPNCDKCVLCDKCKYYENTHHFHQQRLSL